MVKALHNFSIAMKKKAVEYSLKAEKQDFPVVKVRSSEDVMNFARQLYHEDINIYESSFILLLNHANNTVGYAKISQGGICSTSVDIRIICKYAIETLSPAVIFLHNHPSGNTNPSNDDKMLTKRLFEALKTLDIKLLDSIVLTEDGYLSMSDEGMF